ncbi:MAG: hypothetical protein MUC49_02090 [Raineya sp.]|jgi:hypothetical protein|nr:hypothetical protein [Raineya sp.]
MTNVTNGAQAFIQAPYVVKVKIVGTSAILFHRWNNEAVAEKAKAKKGSAAKKMDDVETYVYRDEEGNICIPTEYLRMAIVNSGKSFQDPRSPRKTASDLLKAAIVSIELLNPILVKGEKTKEWDELFAAKVNVQRNGITRVRPMFHKGWQAEFCLQINLPEYVDEMFLLQIINNAGRTVGVADFRPTYGRFEVVNFEKI